MLNPFFYPYGYSLPKYRSSPQQTENNPFISMKKDPYDYFDLGEPAPDFTLEGIVNKQPKKVSLSDYKGKWVLLFFYGSDFTFV
ncbi:redoxin domain-containing protein [Crassaminicella profunda]|nr:redoxin domain-containing protein [Crassaminicella profunda]